MGSARGGRGNRRPAPPPPNRAAPAQAPNSAGGTPPASILFLHPGRPVTDSQRLHRDEKETGRIRGLQRRRLRHRHHPPGAGAQGAQGGLSAASLRAALLEQWPSHAAFLVSFLTVGTMWINHHRLFSLMRGSSEGLLVLNRLQLLTATVVPFPTALVAEHLGDEGGVLAVALCGGLALHFAIPPRPLRARS